MHCDHWSCRLQQLRNMIFVDDNPSLMHSYSFELFDAHVLQSAHGIWDSESEETVTSPIPISLFLSHASLAATSNSKENRSMNAAWNSHDFSTFTLLHRGPDRRHIRISSVLHCHSSRQTSIKLLSRRSANFARSSPPPPVDL